MPRRTSLAPVTLAAGLLVGLASLACQQGGETKKTEPKKTETPAVTAPPAAAMSDTATSLDKAVSAIDLPGPAPPEASAVFLTADAALIPLAC